MVLKSYEYKGKIYSINKTTLEDVPAHIELVRSFWESTGTDIDLQQKVMEQSVKQNLSAYVTCNDKIGAVAYLVRERDRLFTARMFWCRSYRETAILFGYAYYVRNIHTFWFYPHDPDSVPFKKMIATGYDKAWIEDGKPIKVEVNSFWKKKFNDIYNKAKVVKV